LPTIEKGGARLEAMFCGIQIPHGSLPFVFSFEAEDDLFLLVEPFAAVAFIALRDIP
jgi:hypothetical protein